MNNNQRNIGDNLMEKVDDLMDKVNDLGDRMMGSKVGQKISAGMSSMSFKMKELFQGNQADNLVDEATAETLDGPDWATNVELCDMINHERISSVDVIRAIKNRLGMKNARVRYLTLVLLQTVVNNCVKGFSEVAADRVLDEMVKMIGDPQTVEYNRNKALIMIEAWGESNELRYLPAYEETYKSLKSRGICFPGHDSESLAPIFTPSRSVPPSEVYYSVHPQNIRIPVPVRRMSAPQTKEAFDVARNSLELLSTVLSSSPQQDALQDDLTSTLVQQCRQSQLTVQRVVETCGDDEVMLFEALSVNDELQKVVSKYEEMKKCSQVRCKPEPAMIAVTAEEPDEPPQARKEESLIRKVVGSNHNDDEMVFGKKSSSSSEPKKDKLSNYDLISF
ncbi:putative target of Myb protein [Helianthus annuus]|nr:TOM1-like protein 1 [Helianthus annuus]KAJ0580977.1 putative target of Myb protein [Helianthus annuus]KAJ0588743.1 putative target of Myb protein [Helianthus annuus]KAJ0596918.1 putative target of Myb protein [Helianthus annuus]KAJ0757600.1 putative target of Myb protein [Helianthus annuus]KAJ0796332.1 putative target of Myb protein [Helianthus annuus]